MVNERLRYIQSFVDAVDSVESGRKGMISDNDLLISGYRAEYYDIIRPQLKNRNPLVVKETALLLSKVKERRALDDVREIMYSDNGTINGACTAYLRAIEVDDDTIPKLIDVMKHDSGAEFRSAALKLKRIARDEDIPAIREIYGQVRGDLKKPVLDILVSIIARYPELESQKHLILSEPVYPDEKKFIAFLDKSEDYIDKRYTVNYSDAEVIRADVFSNIASAFRKIQIRLYNERDNLKYYSPETKKKYERVKDLLIWGAENLQEKEVSGARNSDSSGFCPICGSKMIRSTDGWVCIECDRRTKS